MSTSLQTNKTSAISWITSIESLGGSAGYKKNPEAFKGILPAKESQALANKEKIVLETQKLSVSDAYGHLNTLKAFAQANNDERVRKIALPLGNVKIDAGEHAASVQSLLSKIKAQQGEDRRNLKLIQGIEKLGGSAALQKPLNLVDKTTHSLDKAAKKIWYASAATVSISASFIPIVFLNVILDAGSGFGLSFEGSDQSGEAFSGTLFYRDIDYLASDVNTFSIEEVDGEGVPPACILWYLGEEAVASFLIDDARFIGLQGQFCWFQDTSNDSDSDE
jgi:hypothetical protein